MPKNNKLFQSNAWKRALTIPEISQIIRKGRVNILDVEITKEALKKIEKCKEDINWNDKGKLDKKLRKLGLSEEEFKKLLSLNVEKLQIRKPTWAKKLLINLKEEYKINNLPDFSNIFNTNDFLVLTIPFINSSIDELSLKLNTIIKENKDIFPEKNELINILYIELPAQLLSKINRTLILELNVAKINSILKRKNKEERYKEYIELLKDKTYVNSLYDEYPVMFRLIQNNLNNWVKNNVEFITRFSKDYKDLCQLYNGGKDLGTLKKIESQISDAHKGGKGVIIAQFSTGIKIVYKPKALSIDLHFQELLEKLNNKTNFNFPILKILNNKSYGWINFIEFKPCINEDEVKLFYYKLGGLLALLYAIESADFHFENIISCGQDPYLIDLETIIHSNIDNLQLINVDVLINNIIYLSVLRIGLLPRQIDINNFERIDISGIGRKKGQLSPFNIPCIKNPKSDDIVIEREKVIMGESKNKPTLGNNEINVKNYINEILSGFSIMYSFIMDDKDYFTKKNGVIDSFSKDILRVVLRPTYTYARMLGESTHPDLLRNAFDRDTLFFDKLWKQANNKYNNLYNIINFEQEDIWNGDIPFFYTKLNTRDIFSSHNKRIKNYIKINQVNELKQHINSFNKIDLKRQIWINNISLKMMSEDENKWTKQNFNNKKVYSTLVNNNLNQRIIQAIDIVETRIRESSISYKKLNEVNWIGTVFGEKNYWNLYPLNLSLYNGLPGIAIFYTNLYLYNQNKIYLSFLTKIKNTIFRQIKDNISNLKSIGAYDGWGGILYVLKYMKIIFNDDNINKLIKNILEILPELILNDKYNDIISGKGGCLLSLLSLEEYNKSKNIKKCAKLCAEELIKCAEKQEKGIGWQNLNEKQRPLSGFAHGNAGIAYALFKYYRITLETKYLSYINSSLEYEKSLFNEKIQNWIDLRFPGSDASSKNNIDKQAIGWCHGAPGIGLSRIDLVNENVFSNLKEEIDIAIKTTIKSGFGNNHSICHGDLGNLELIIMAKDKLGYHDLNTTIDEKINIIVNDILNFNPICGTPYSIETPGLMTGLAGIGYQLLKLIDKNVPSILLMESRKK